MVFSPTEMVTMYRQAKDKKKQIKIFCHTESISEEECKRILTENGLRFQELPRSERKKKAIDPECIPDEEGRPVEDAVLDALEPEEQEEEKVVVTVKEASKMALAIVEYPGNDEFPLNKFRKRCMIPEEMCRVGGLVTDKHGTAYTIRYSWKEGEQDAWSREAILYAYEEMEVKAVYALVWERTECRE